MGLPAPKANGSPSEALLVPDRPDAGLRSIHHCKSNLLCISVYSYTHKWKADIHPLQTRIDSLDGALDFYFALTANLGTHTFFMFGLPLWFWCGYTDLGRGIVHILAGGVIFSGLLKDSLCLPRPMSPPLKRISMSESAALEYGFPSTHTTNALSVVVYALLMLDSAASSISPTTRLVAHSLLFLYAFSIVLGRIYCGMHGFLDVAVGGAIGVLLPVGQFMLGEAFDQLMRATGFTAPIVVVLAICLLVRLHPEPADDCPCFDDSVSFAGVLIGLELGYWHYSNSAWAWDTPVPATVPFDISKLGWVKAVLRILLGVVIIVAWKETMKPTLLWLLPPIFRVMEKLGLSIPRRFFVQASEYNKIPSHLKGDNVMPSVTELPSLINSIRRRRRAVSIGPQSAADAYETLAYRENQRRESVASIEVPSTALSPNLDKKFPGNENESTPPQESPLLGSPGSADRYDLVTEEKERNLFSQLEKPRVRYDVEVVTKLIVYAGIALLAVEGNPILFEILGLGMS
ncbi:MAG: hypothetical protein M1829_004758 [Trizodia sp. TS-e1964]|nr:MAG: hypothetical protein M1829_004758 [Trizodia sp. TS-e1964]